MLNTYRSPGHQPSRNLEYQLNTCRRLGHQLNQTTSRRLGTKIDKKWKYIRLPV